MNPQLNIFEVHANSLAVYKDKVLPNLTGRKLQVLEALKKLGGEGTMYEVGQLLNLPLNNISGRFSELKKLQLITENGNKQHHGNSFTIFKVV